MKFCKNLQKVIDMADPAWAPFWLNYKFLKKLIKNLPSFDDVEQARQAALDSDASSLDETDASTKQNGGDATVEKASSGKRPRQSSQAQQQEPLSQNNNQNQDPSASPLGQCPNEIAFFKCLHAELKKAEFFFKHTTKEFHIRQERLRRGMEVIKGQSRSMVDDKWRTMSRAMYLLYKDLLLLETFAIMTYVGFSKILKKHDKVTGYRTCNAYMESIVNGANFTHYPEVMSMVSRCESLYKETSEALEHEGIKALSEDEQLFICMIQRVSGEVLGDDKMHGVSLRHSPPLQPKSPDSKAVEDLRELLAQGSNEIGAEGESDDGETSEKPPAKKVAKR